HHDVCHRDGDYAAVVERLQEKLRPVFRASPAHEMILLTGSGTSAMEMAISSVVPPGKKILVVANGAFGERLDRVRAPARLPRRTASRASRSATRGASCPTCATWRARWRATPTSPRPR